MSVHQNNTAWHIVSLILLAIYLACFHVFNASTPEQIPAVATTFGSAWLVTCFVCQTVFRNRFEFGIHSLVAIDFMLEGLIPNHSGYGFYLCAAGFWSLFLVYHYWPLLGTSNEDAALESGVG